MRGQKTHTILPWIQVHLLPVVKGWGVPLKFFMQIATQILTFPTFSQLRGVLQDLYLQEDKVHLQANVGVGCRLNRHNPAGLPQ